MRTKSNQKSLLLTFDCTFGLTCNRVLVGHAATLQATGGQRTPVAGLPVGALRSPVPSPRLGHLLDWTAALSDKRGLEDWVQEGFGRSRQALLWRAGKAVRMGGSQDSGSVEEYDARRDASRQRTAPTGPNARSTRSAGGEGRCVCALCSPPLMSSRTVTHRDLVRARFHAPPNRPILLPSLFCFTPFSNVPN